MQIRYLTKDQWKICKDFWAFLGGWEAGYVLRYLEQGGLPGTAEGQAALLTTNH